MEKHYVTFGQNHTHRVNNKTLDCDTVAVLKVENYAEGRKKAFELFGDKFGTSYHEEQWSSSMLRHFPNGYIFIN